MYRYLCDYRETGLLCHILRVVLFFFQYNAMFYEILNEIHINQDVRNRGILLVFQVYAWKVDFLNFKSRQSSGNFAYLNKFFYLYRFHVPEFKVFMP